LDENNVTLSFFYLFLLQNRNGQKPKRIRLKETMQYAFQGNDFELNYSTIMAAPYIIFVQTTFPQQESLTLLFSLLSSFFLFTLLHPV